MPIITSKQPFDQFMSELIETNVGLDYYADFEKISANVDKMSMKLHQLNYLIGQTDFERAVRLLWEENASVFSVLGILIAVRDKEKKKAFDKQGNLRLVTDFLHSIESVLEYFESTGLKKVFQNRQIRSVPDYVFGVETGLDSHARKNRGGKLMETCIEALLQEYHLFYRSEVYSTEFPELQCLGEDRKRFDFVIPTAEKTYLLEVNFYSSGGSKLNEVARAYSELSPKINATDQFEFVWITDGQGWNAARNKLEEAYSVIPRIYNLTNIRKFLDEVKSYTQ